MMFENNDRETTVHPILTQKKYYQPVIKIEHNALIKMACYVKLYEKEIGWLGFVEKTKNEYLITDVVLLKQKTTATTTELDEDGMQEFANELIAQGRTEDLSKIRCWGHSHVDMAVNPSGTDDETFAEYYKECAYFIRIIANKKGEMRIDFADNTEGVVYNNVKWSLVCPMEIQAAVNKINSMRKEITELEEGIKSYNETVENNLKESVEKEIEKNVKTSCTTFKNTKSTVKSYDGYDWGGWSGYDWDSSYYYNGYLNDTPKKDEKDSEIFEGEEEAELLAREMELYTKIFINKGTTNEKVVPIHSVLSETDIMEIYNHPEVVRTKKYKNMKVFKNYDEADWDELIYAAEVYFTYAV